MGQVAKKTQKYGERANVSQQRSDPVNVEFDCQPFLHTQHWKSWPGSAVVECSEWTSTSTWLLALAAGKRACNCKGCCYWAFGRGRGSVQPVRPVWRRCRRGGGERKVGPTDGGCHKPQQVALAKLTCKRWCKCLAGLVESFKLSPRTWAKVDAMQTSFWLTKPIHIVRHSKL